MWQLFLLAFKAFFALATHPVFHVLWTVCRFGFRALHQCKKTADLQSDTGFWFGRCRVASSLELQARRGRLSSHLALALAKQVVYDSCSPFLMQQKEFFAPSTTHAVPYNTTFSQSPTRVFKSHLAS